MGEHAQNADKIESNIRRMQTQINHIQAGRDFHAAGFPVIAEQNRSLAVKYEHEEPEDPEEALRSSQRAANHAAVLRSYVAAHP